MEIAKLREKGRDLKDQAKADWERKLAELETKRDAARAKLAEFRDSARRGLERCAEGCPVGLGRVGKSVPRRVVGVLIVRWSSECCERYEA